MSDIGSPSWRAQVEACNNAERARIYHANRDTHTLTVGRITDLPNARERQAQRYDLLGAGDAVGAAMQGYIRPTPEPPDLSTPTKVLDAHIAMMRASALNAAGRVANAQRALDHAIAERDHAVKALADFEAEMAKRG